MTALYKKRKLWFAILWIIVYVIGMSAADGLSAAIGVEKCPSLPLLLLMSAVLLRWIIKQNLTQKFGLCPPIASAGKFLYYLPLAAMVSCNLWLGVRMNLTVLETALYVGCMLCVGLLEELIFRGLLFTAMKESSLTAAVIVSSLTFGIGHIVNLFNGSGAELPATLCQIVYATAAGFLFVMIFHRGGSLLPCILTHSILNALSAFAVEPTLRWEIITALLLTALTLGYTLILHKTLPKAE